MKLTKERIEEIKNQSVHFKIEYELLSHIDALESEIAELKEVIRIYQTPAECDKREALKVIDQLRAENEKLMATLKDAYEDFEQIRIYADNEETEMVCKDAKQNLSALIGKEGE